MSKYNVGDTVSVTGTITNTGTCCGPEYTVKFERHNYGDFNVSGIAEKNVTLVKKATPPAPAGGTVVDWSGYKLIVTNAKDASGANYLTRVYSDGSTMDKYFVWDGDLARNAKVLA